MKLENLLSEFKEGLMDNQMLTEAGIRIPKGARAAKIIHH
jgi:ATP-dependent Zn protease